MTGQGRDRMNALFQPGCSKGEGGDAEQDLDRGSAFFSWLRFGHIFSNPPTGIFPVSFSPQCSSIAALEWAALLCFLFLLLSFAFAQRESVLHSPLHSLCRLVWHRFHSGSCFSCQGNHQPCKAPCPPLLHHRACTEWADNLLLPALSNHEARLPSFLCCHETVSAGATSRQFVLLCSYALKTTD